MTTLHCAPRAAHRSPGRCLPIALSVAMSVLSGCTWYGYRPPEADSWVHAGVPSCPRIGLQNVGLPHQRSILRRAMAEACAIIHSDAFALEMSRRRLRRSCSDGPTEPGAEVVRRLRTEVPDFSIVLRQPRNSVAVTDLKREAMAITPARLVSWYCGDSGPLVNTLVHEMTHLIGQDGRSLYQDGGHGRGECTDDTLASYVSGDVAEEIWRRGADHPNGRPGCP